MFHRMKTALMTLSVFSLFLGGCYTSTRHNHVTKEAAQLAPSQRVSIAVPDELMWVAAVDGDERVGTDGYRGDRIWVAPGKHALWLKFSGYNMGRMHVYGSSMLTVTVQAGHCYFLEANELPWTPTTIITPGAAPTPQKQGTSWSPTLSEYPKCD